MLPPQCFPHTRSLKNAHSKMTSFFLLCGTEHSQSHLQICFSVCINIYAAAVNNIRRSHQNNFRALQSKNSILKNHNPAVQVRARPRQTTLTTSSPSRVKTSPQKASQAALGASPVEVSAIRWCMTSGSLSRRSFGRSSAHMRRHHLKNICHSDK